MENDDVNDDDVNDAKRHLIDELSNEQSNIKVLRIRNICRDYPGIISTTGLRLRIWSLLLLGQEDASVEQGIIYIIIIIIIIIIISSTAVFVPTSEKCDEQQVLDADVRRTR